MNEEKAIRLFIADDHPLLRVGLRLSLNERKDVKLIGEAPDGFSAVEKIQADPPDVALIDVDMPNLSGIGVIRILRKSLSRIKIIVLSTYSDESYIQEAMEAGADGYVLKNVGFDDLVEIIKAFHAGNPKLSPYLVNLTTCYAGHENKDEKTQGTSLTVREKEVLQLVTAGKGNKEIAHMLFISPETVKSHVRNIFEKLKVKNRVEAAMIARKNKLRV